jgi:hypothetical protein
LDDLANALSERETATTELANARTELANAVESIAGLQAQLATERAERAAELVNRAIAEGRVLQADAETRKAELVNAGDFNAARDALLSAEPVLKTTPVSRDLGSRSSDLRQRQDKILELVNARMSETREDYPTAFAAIRNCEEHAALFLDEPAH